MDKAQNLTFFAKPQFYLERGTVMSRYPHLHRTSSLIRGEQIANYLGCKYNPTEGYENDTLVYVKPDPILLDDIPAGAWIDILDNFYLFKKVRRRPHLNLIFCSQYHYDLFKGRYSNKSVMIPHHHCNFEREVRPHREIKTVGFIGNKRGIDIAIPEITQRLKDIGLDFVTNYTFRGREDSMEFYRNIDIQLAWKPDDLKEHTPMKITNASSFGIPSVAKRCENYKELDGYYVAVDGGVDEMIQEIEKLKDPIYYQEWSDKLVKDTERYHISNIAKLYEQLL